MKSISNLGIAPVVAVAIVALVTEGINYGLSYYAAVQQAKEQAKLERELLESEVSAIAYQLSLQTNVSYSQWYNIVKLTFVPVIPGTEPQPLPVPKKDYTIYIVFGVLGVLILSRGMK